MKHCSLFLKEKHTFHQYAILEYVTEDRDLTDVLPGQFFMLGADTLLKKPISVLDADHRSGTIRFLVRKVGRGTGYLYRLAPGCETEAVGPLGMPFPEPAGKVVLVGGGSGIPPLYFMARRLSREQVFVIYGGRDETEIVPLFGKGMPHRITTDDGSLGLKGTVVDGLERLFEDRPVFREAVIYSCGPEPMVRAIQQAFPGHRHFTSLERYMGCGFGVCLGCVVKTRDGYRKSCTDGPVFDVEEIIWDE